MKRKTRHQRHIHFQGKSIRIQGIDMQGATDSTDFIVVIPRFHAENHLSMELLNEDNIY